MPLRSRVTMADIAEKTGVSLSTVSLVLRDKPGVGAETRARVLRAAKELGYIPRNSGAQYRANLTSVGLILKSEPARVPRANPFYSHVLAGIEVACRQLHANLLYATMPVDEDSHPLELPRILAEGKTVDGLLLVGAFLTDALGKIAANRSTPVVLVDSYASSDAYDSVISDNFQGAHLAVTYLIEQGHRHVGFVGGHQKAYPSIVDRRKGYIRALQDEGISDHYFADCHIRNKEEIFESTADLLRRNPQLTAIFASNDEVAFTVMEAAQALNHRIPDELSVVGFDNIDLAEWASPPLTTLHVDKVGMGRLAVCLLGNRVESPEASPVTAVIRTQLVERGSVRRI